MTPLDFASDTECRVEETLSEARSAAKKIIEEASAEANRLRNSCLSKAGEEARAIKREAYLRARLMLDRISRKLQSQFDSCLQDVTAAGIDAYRELVDQFLKLRVALDDLSFTASDSSSQILEKFCSDTNDIVNA